MVTPAIQLNSFIRNIWFIPLISGISALIFGIITLVWPGPTLVVVSILFGIYLIALGVSYAAGAFIHRLAAWVRILHFLLGLATLILGIIAIANPLESISFLAIWVGVGWIAGGIFGIAASAALPAYDGRVLDIVLSIIVAIAGFVVLAYPLHSARALLIAAGSIAIAVGVLEIVVAVRLRKLSALATT